MASIELVKLTKAIADWSAPDGAGMTFYVYGSRVRGDHRPDSDVDIHYVLPERPTHEFTVWWTELNRTDFASLRAILPGRLEFLERGDPLGREIENGQVAYRERNVVCVDRKSHRAR